MNVEIEQELPEPIDANRVNGERVATRGTHRADARLPEVARLPRDLHDTMRLTLALQDPDERAAECRRALANERHRMIEHEMIHDAMWGVPPT